MSMVPLSTVFKSQSSSAQGINPTNEISISGMVADLEQAIAQMKDSVRFWTPDGPTIGLNSSNYNSRQGTDDASAEVSAQSSEHEEEEEEEMNWSDVMSASDGTDTGY